MSHMFIVTTPVNIFNSKTENVKENKLKATENNSNLSPFEKYVHFGTTVLCLHRKK